MAKTKALIICVFVFAYTKGRLSHNEAQIWAIPVNLHFAVFLSLYVFQTRFADDSISKYKFKVKYCCCIVRLIILYSTSNAIKIIW